MGAMSEGYVVALLVPLAYLVGCLPSAALVTRRLGVDVTTEGSGNPGASNVYRLAGWRPAALVFALDFAKGAVPTAVGLYVNGHRGAYVLGIAALVGHMWPVTQRFRGGRGVATGAGMILVIYPTLCAGMALLWFAVARVTHKASLASVTCAVAFPIGVAAAGHPARDIVIVSILAAIVIARHFANLRRLVRGEELDLGAPPPGGDDRADG
jgi:glycerol-3-phosphate acyltransferase PlsY